MTRSGLRRYPGEIVRSLLGRALEGIEPDGRLDPDADRHALAAVWLGHASVLIRLGGRWILTDPVLGERIGIRVGGRVLGLGRLTKPPLIVEHLPRIDLILISHAHYDHLDRTTLARLASPHTTVITPSRTRSLIPAGFGHVIELPWDRPLRARGLSIVAIRPEHWGARRGIDRKKGYNSFVLRCDGHGVLFVGDTARTAAFDDLSDIDLSIFGIGAYDPWIHQHATPEQVWAMHQRLGARWLMPVHHSTFPMSDEHPDEPLARLLAVAGDKAPHIVGQPMGTLWAHEITSTRSPCNFHQDLWSASVSSWVTKKDH